MSCLKMLMGKRSSVFHGCTDGAAKKRDLAKSIMVKEGNMDRSIFTTFTLYDDHQMIFALMAQPKKEVWQNQLG